jgi:DDE superfamily endonuclease
MRKYLQNNSDGLSRFGRSPLYGCTGAIDGIAIRIQEPARGSIPNQSTYYNRKEFFALAVQSMCDNRYVFTFASAISPGSTHDSVSFGISSLSRLLFQRDGGLLPGYWIAADDANVCRDRFLTPWPGRNLSRSKNSFNYWQSSARIYIEQAFGMLVARCGVIWHPLRVPIDKAGIIVIVYMKLHNVIIECCEMSLVSSGSVLCVPDPSGFDNVGHRDAADV